MFLLANSSKSFSLSRLRKKNLLSELLNNPAVDVPTNFLPSFLTDDPVPMFGIFLEIGAKPLRHPTERRYGHYAILAGGNDNGRRATSGKVDFDTTAKKFLDEMAGIRNHRSVNLSTPSFAQRGESDPAKIPFLQRKRSAK